MRLCACGCGQAIEYKTNQKYFYGHRTKEIEENYKINKWCKCGCDAEIPKGTNYVLGHHIKGKKINVDRSGEKSANYRHGNIYKLYLWRRLVKERDNYTCQCCEADINLVSSENILAHHIKDKRTFPELKFDLDNGLTLCRSCHSKIHANTRSEETKKKMLVSNANRGKPAWNRGVPRTGEEKAKISKIKLQKAQERFILRRAKLIYDLQVLCF